MTNVTIVLDDFNVYIHQYYTKVPAKVEDFDITIWGAKTIIPELDYSGYIGYDVNGLPYPKAYVPTATDNQEIRVGLKRPKSVKIETRRDSINYQELNILMEWMQTGQEIIVIDGASKLFTYPTPFASPTGVWVGGNYTVISDGSDTIGTAAYYGAYAGYINSINGDIVHQAKAVEGNHIIEIMITKIGIQRQDNTGSYPVGQTELIGWFSET